LFKEKSEGEYVILFVPFVNSTLRYHIQSRMIQFTDAYLDIL